MKVVFTGGGTGGHIFPIIAIIRELKRNYPPSLKDLRIFYLGPKDGFGKNLLQKEGVIVKTVLSGKLRRYFTIADAFRNFIDLFFRIPIGFLQAFWHLYIIAPEIIFSKGGYGSLPVIFAGWVLRIPIFLHESDSVPGLANKIASRFAAEVFTAFSVGKTEYFPKEKMLVVGNPIRQEILQGSEKEGKKLFNLTEEKPVLLVLGGSQGAQKINDVVLKALPELLKGFEVIHQCGEKNYQEVLNQVNLILEKEENLKKYYHLYGFLDEDLLKHAYKVAHLVISRAGSGAIFEITANGLPSILIPLPGAAQNHQRKNAYICEDAGAASVIEESNFQPYFLMEKLRYLFSRPEKLSEMSIRAKEFALPKSANIIAQYIIEYLKLIK
jgi:UDP-N-acetylglucosamine--N-acetylmuramyl-(pentapeptide) pyrophosphoryl-undecaprenol N-acetylglucosamine transferase